MDWKSQYQSSEHAQFYADKRDATFMRRMSNRSEQRMIYRALERLHRKAAFSTVLDCASGTGRMLPVLAKFDVSVVALDSAAAMLMEGRRVHHLFGAAPGMVVGSALELPLADKCVDVVFCSRLLHHFEDSASRIQILREFARIARVGVVVSFFDSLSYRGWRRAKKNRKRHREHGRFAVRRDTFRQEGEAAGLDLLGMNALFRFHAEVTAATFLVGQKNAAHRLKTGATRESPHRLENGTTQCGADRLEAAVAQQASGGSCAEWLKASGLGSVQGLMDFRPTSVAAQSASSDTFRVECAGAAEGESAREIYVKRYRYGGIGRQLGGAFRGTLLGKSRARLEFERLTEMRRRGVPAVAPISYVEDRRWRLLRSCALVTEGEPNAEPLSTYFSRREVEWDLPTRRRFVVAIGGSIAGLHEAGVLHGGLFWRNILVREVEGEDGWRFTYLDPSRGCRFYSGAAPLSARVSDLSDFAASGNTAAWRTDFARFLRSYCGVRSTREQRKSLARAILEAARGKVAGEGNRIGTGAALAWLERRVERRAAPGGADRFETVEAFFEMLGRARPRSAALGPWKVRFELGLNDDVGGARTFTVSMGRDGIVVDEERGGRADLTVRTDAEAWLAIVNADGEALDMIRTGRFALDGDTQPLAVLVQCLDESLVATLSDAR